MPSTSASTANSRFSRTKVRTCSARSISERSSTLRLHSWACAQRRAVLMSRPRPRDRTQLVSHLLACNVFLFRPTAQVLDRDDAARELVVAEQQRNPRPASVGALHLRFDAAAARVDLDAQTRHGLA